MYLKLLNESLDDTKNNIEFPPPEILNELITDLPNKENDPRSAETLRYKAIEDYMDLNKKVYGTEIEDYKETKENKISLTILKALKASIGTLLSVGRTMLTKLFGQEVLFQKIIKEERLSQIMTDMFVNTNVDVYIYTSTMANAYTLPGSHITAKPFMMRFYEILNGGPIRIIMTPLMIFLGPLLIVGLLCSQIFSLLLVTIDQIMNLGINAFKNGNPWKVTYDESQHKVKLNVSNITVYVTANLIKLLDNDEELKAVMLHEIGHNLNHTYSIINRLLSIGLLSTVTYQIYKGYKNQPNMFDDTFTTINKYLPDNTLAKYYTMQFITFMIVLFILFFISYPRRKDETYADENAIKMGYGRELESGLLKLNRLHIPNENLGKKALWIERIGYSISKFLNNIIGFYPTDRLKKIKEKTDQYRTDQSKITEKHINYKPTNEIY